VAVVDIRSETPADHPAIRALHERAFGGPTEARLVDALRAARKLVVSLVAIHQERLVGHLAFSPVTVTDASEGLRAVGLAPMSVLPEFQNRGIGSRLVREGLEICKRQGEAIVVVLGHATYYPRFGFLKAKEYGLENEYGAVDSFMVLELQEGALQNVRGLVTYAPEFRQAGG